MLSQLILIAHAQTNTPWLDAINREIVNPILQFLFILALVVFLWGVFRYIQGGASDTARETGRRHILWGLVGLFIMMGVFGILNLICSAIDCN